MFVDFIRQTIPVNDSEVVGDINQRTRGTEFYGMSSNYVLLNQLFSYAQLHLEQGPVESEYQDVSSRLHRPNPDAHTSSSAPVHTTWDLGSQATGFSSGPGGRAGLVSIVNLLSNEEALIPPSRAKTPQDLTAEELHHSQTPRGLQRSLPASHDQGRSNLAGHAQFSSRIPAFDTTPSREEASSHTTLLTIKRRLEREYVRNYFHNLHYLHPMLDSSDFMALCEDHIWCVDAPNEKAKDRRHFFALYNIVVAVGALVAGEDFSNEFGRELSMYDESLRGHRRPSPPFTSQMFSRIYFRKSWTLLGDVFEVCSLESAQTLLLMVRRRPPCIERYATER
jgi:hypothetical protein